jgi:hypothetical protein
MNFLRLFLILTFFFLSSCEINKPSYSSKTLIPSLEKMLLEEYDIHALVKLTEKTLGVCITVPTILASGKKTMSVVRDQMQDVMMCLRRVLLSTDVPIDFYQISIRSKDAPGTEVVMMHYLQDYKIYILSGISQDDFLKRMVYRNENNIAALGKERIELFFKALETQDPQLVFSSHFIEDAQYPNISKDFSLQMHESAMKLHVQHEIIDVRMKALNEETYYMLCTVRETFEPKQGFQDSNFSTYSGQTQTYLFKMSLISYYHVRIMEILLKNDMESKSQEKWNTVVQKFGNPESWAASDFYVFPYELKTFIAEQIAYRVVDLATKPDLKMAEDKKMSPPRITNVHGFFENDSFKFVFHYSDAKKSVTKKDIELTLATTRDVCRNYRFSEYKNVAMTTPYGVYSTHSTF